METQSSHRAALASINFRRSGPGKPNQRKGQNEKFMNFAHFVTSGVFSLGKQARFTLNFCSGMPLRKVHELTFLWFGLPGPLLTIYDSKQHLDLISNEACSSASYLRASHTKTPLSSGEKCRSWSVARLGRRQNVKHFCEEIGNSYCSNYAPENYYTPPFFTHQNLQEISFSPKVQAESSNFTP